MKPLQCRFVVGLLLALAPALGIRASSSADSSATVATSITHRGFTLDFTGLKHPELAPELEAAIRYQFDMVSSVGLPPAVLDFFRQVPITFLEKVTASPAHYSDGKVFISINIIPSRERPVLLHELLHAFHDQRMKDGFKNEQVRMFYERAKRSGVYSSVSHMMENVAEFWACAATVYLNGSAGQEPFYRNNLQHHTPNYFEFIRGQFGPDAGTYEGSRNDPDRKRLAELQKLYAANGPVKPADSSP